MLKTEPPTASKHPPKNSIRCDCRWARDECFKTQERLYREDPGSKFFGYSRLKIPAFMKEDYDESKLGAGEKARLHVVRRCAETMGISEKKLGNRVIHISRHHWRGSALDHVSSRGGNCFVTSVLSFDSREQWVEATGVADEADVFAAAPRFQAFLAPNHSVDEWPALFGEPLQAVPTNAAKKRGSGASLSLGWGEFMAALDDSFASRDGTLPAEEKNLQGVSAAQCDLARVITDCGDAQVANDESAGTTPAAETRAVVPLRQWIERVLIYIQKYDRRAASSPLYLESCLKIALSLARQIKEESTVSAADWADCVVVCLDETDIFTWNGTRKLQPSILNQEEREMLEETPNFDDRIDSFLELFDITNHAGTKSIQRQGCKEEDGWLAGLSCAESESSSSTSDHGEKALGSYHQLPETDESKQSAQCSPSTEHGSCFFNILSAKIMCPYGDLEPTGSENSAKGQAPRIFNLGLVLYEMFSGGETVPSKLRDLAVLDGAFLSLSTLTLVDVENNDESSQAAPKRLQRPSAPGKGGLCRLLCENLRFMGLCQPLCDLIFNTLDSIHGDMCGKECYTTIAEVETDLKLMLEKPQRFLLDLDLDNLSSSGLPLSDVEIPRTKELDVILSCYRRYLLGLCEVVIIEGESGSGKSRLSLRVGNLVNQNGGVFLVGKFDQMQEAARPFSALTAAFDAYCDLLISMEGSEWAQTTIKKLNHELGPDACHLSIVIPKLGQVMGTDLSYVNSIDLSGRNTLERFHHLIIKFVDVISTVSILPVTICLDDMQWADEASVSVLRRLLGRAHGKLFVVFCCRDNEIGENYQFCNMLDDVRAAGVNTTTVTLNCMKEDVLNDLIADLLCLSPRLVRSLTDTVYKRTQGNPLFVNQLLLSLHRDGLLHLDFSRRRWVWDEVRLPSLKLLDNVASYFIQDIERLELDVQSAIHALSLFGASIRCEYLQLLESELGLKFIDPLESAKAKGLVTKIEGSFHFTHDRIQEACYSKFGDRDRRFYHMMYGLCLVKAAIEACDDAMLFTAVNQINLGGPTALANAEDCFEIAQHNLKVGKKAIEMAEFRAADYYFENGLTFLSNHWAEEHYGLSLQLYELACKTALANGNVQRLQILSDEMMKHAKCFEDTLGVHYIIIQSLAYSLKLPEALERSLMIISKLGNDIPDESSAEVLEAQVKLTQSLLENTSEDDILNHRLMTDTNKLISMKFLARLQSIAFFANPSIHPFVIMQMVQITMSFGLSPFSPFGLVCFGSYLSKLGNIKTGYRFMLLAQSLLHKLGADEYKGELLCLLAQLKCYVEPMQAACGMWLDAEAAATKAGDVDWMCINRLEYCGNAFWSGINLAVAKKEISCTRVYAKEHEHRTCETSIIMAEKVTSMLTGQEAECHTVNLEDCTNIRQKNNFAFFNLYISLILNRNEVKKWCEILVEFEESEQKSHVLLVGDAMKTFYVGIASFQIYRESRDPSWAARGRIQKEALKHWAEDGSAHNFEHKYLLVAAEEHYSLGEFELAREAYNDAIKGSIAHKFVNEESIACELAGRFLLDTGDIASSMQHFRQAHDAYGRWGADAKASALFAFITEQFAPFLDGSC